MIHGHCSACGAPAQQDPNTGHWWHVRRPACPNRSQTVFAVTVVENGVMRTTSDAERPARFVRRMTWRVVYSRPGVAPEAHNFAYRQAADDWAALCRAGGWEAEVCEIDADSDSRPSVADLAAEPGSPRVVRRSEGREALRSGAERFEGEL